MSILPDRATRLLHSQLLQLPRHVTRGRMPWKRLTESQWRNFRRESPRCGPYLYSGTSLMHISIPFIFRLCVIDLVIDLCPAVYLFYSKFSRGFNFRIDLFDVHWYIFRGMHLAVAYLSNAVHLHDILYMSYRCHARRQIRRGAFLW